MHVAFILDGNRRHADKHFMERIFGHRAGVSALDKIIHVAPKYGIDTITVYALSTENIINRSKKEIEDIFQVMVEAVRKYKRKLIGNNVRAKLLGNIALLPQKFADMIMGLEEETKSCTGQLLQICIAYGGKDEIVRAVRRVLENGQEVNEETIAEHLDSRLQPDLIIRTGGNHRSSNFLTWQAAYSEWYYTDTLWPDFDEQELQKALKSYDPKKVNLGK